MTKPSLRALSIAACFALGFLFGGTSCKKSGNSAAACPQGQTACNGQCTLTQFDPSNCGACGTACPAGQVCQSGACSAASCTAGFTACGSGCADLKKDVGNCGACGKACPAGELCSAGTCSGSCLGGYSACPTTGTPTYCASLQTDPQNCGACGKACSGSQVCMGGACGCGVDAISTATVAVCTHRVDSSVLCRPASGGYIGNGFLAYSGAMAFAETAGNVCMLKSDGTVWCWGDDGNDILGNDSAEGASGVPLQVRTNSATPVGDMGAPTATYLTGIKQISVGGGHSSGGTHACALNSSGQVWCWGRGTEGELGVGTSSSTFAIQATLSGPTNIVKVVAGNEHSCVLAKDGSVWCFGDNSSAQLGVGDANPHTGAVQVMVSVQTGDMGTNTPLGGITDLATSNDDTCAVKSDHTLWCWGDNTNGQLGVGDTNPHTTAVEVMADAMTSFAGTTQVTVGEVHACAIKTDGTAWCWGGNHATNGNNPWGGMLGNNTTTSSSFPVQVLMAGATPAPLTGVTSISAGHRNTCAVVGATHQPYCWGINGANQLGLANVKEVHVATPYSSCGQ